MTNDILNTLYETLQGRKNSAPSESYVASLYNGGGEKIGRKIVEEASEVLIEAVKGHKDNLADESADLLFHMLVLLSHYDIKPEAVLNVLRARMGVSGHTEKASRSVQD